MFRFALNNFMLPLVFILFSVYDVCAYPKEPTSGAFGGKRQGPTESSLSRRTLPFYPQNQIICTGELPRDWWTGNLASPRTDGVEEYHIPRELCAQEAYGGKANFNAGFRCSHDEFQIGVTRSMVIQGTWPYPDLFNGDLRSKVLAFCLIRCQCLPPGTVFSNQRPALEILATEMIPPAPYMKNGYVLHRMRATTGGSDLAIPEVLIDPTDQPIRTLAHQATHDVEPPSDYLPPSCYGPFPPWTLPAPFDNPESHDFGPPDDPDSIQRLCSAMWFGGSMLGNAGLLCKRVGHMRIMVVKEIVFNPALSRLNRLQPLLGLAVEYWCYRACTCDLAEISFADRPQKIVRVPDLFENMPTAAYFSKPGSVVVSRYPAPKGPSDMVLLTGPQSQHTRCRPDGYVPGDGKLCRWDGDKFDDWNSSHGTCGGECASFQDCAGTVRSDCRCVTERRDTLAPGGSIIARCTSIAMLQATVKYRGGGRYLGGRDVPVDLDITCPCNETFTSRDCCDVPDGIVSIERREMEPYGNASS